MGKHDNSHARMDICPDVRAGRPTTKTTATNIRELNAATLPDATSRVTKILDANYEKADLHAVIKSWQHQPSKTWPIYATQKYKPLFNCTYIKQQRMLRQLLIKLINELCGNLSQFPKI